MEETLTSAPRGHEQLGPELWRCMLELLPLRQRAMCCRVCKAWEKDLEKTVDYRVATLCSLLAEKGAADVLRLLLQVHSQGIPEDLGRLDQVRRFLERNSDAFIVPPEGMTSHIVAVDDWVQLAS